MCSDEINIYISAFWVKQTAIRDWVGLVQSVEGPNRTENWPPPSKKEFFQPSHLNCSTDTSGVRSVPDLHILELIVFMPSELHEPSP